MPLIEGVGDEVVQFGAVVLVLLVAVLAWWSTNARPDRYRTVLVMRSRSHPVTVSIRTRSNLMLSSTQTNNAPQPTSSDGPQAASSSEPAEETPRDNARVIPLQEMDSIVDADMAMLDNNRLHFYRRMDTPGMAAAAPESVGEEGEAGDEAEPASNAQMREMDSIVSAMEADVSADCDFFRANASNSTESSTAVPVKKQDKKNLSTSTAKESPPTEGANVNENSEENASTSNDEEGSRRKILIKLKYLNDTLKEVEGSLDELLKDFKLRHFSSELSSECRVRLIFNGRVLGDEGATLRACGLHHRAVVHCLVHPNRNRSQPHMSDDSNGNATHELITERPQPERAWDLENILMTLVSVALTIVWFFRCEYSNMFTASASVALFGLTVFYSVAIFALYLSDTFQLERRPAPPAPPAPPVPPPAN